MTSEYIIPLLGKTDINPDLLQQELATAGYSTGVSWAPSQWIIFVFDETSNAQIQTVVDAHNPNTLTTEQQIASDKQSILGLATTAKNFSPSIASIWASIVNSDYNSDDTNTRFTGLRTAVDLQGAGFQTALHTALESETGLTDLVLGATPTTAQKQQYNLWVRSFCLTWAFMITLG